TFIVISLRKIGQSPEPDKTRFCLFWPGSGTADRTPRTLGAGGVCPGSERLEIRFVLLGVEQGGNGLLPGSLASLRRDFARFLERVDRSPERLLRTARRCHPIAGEFVSDSIVPVAQCVPDEGFRRITLLGRASALVRLEAGRWVEIEVAM